MAQRGRMGAGIMALAIREILANRANFGSTRSLSSIKYIVLHYTANDGDKAENNAKYFQTAHKPASSAHYFVDDYYIVRSVPDNYVAYAVGGDRYFDVEKTGGAKLYKKVTNANSISIEMCDTKKDGKYQASEKTIKRAVDICMELMEKYNIDIDHVVRHFDVTGKHCPVYFMDNAAWEGFKKRIRNHNFETGKSYVTTQACYLRRSPGTGGNKVDYNSLSSAVKKKCRQKTGFAIFKKEKNFRLTKVKYVNGNIWGQMKSGYWVPLVYKGKTRVLT